MFIYPLPYLLFFLFSVTIINLMAYLTPFEENFWFGDNLLLFIIFTIIFSFKYKYYDQIKYNEEEYEEDKNEKINYDIIIKAVEITIIELPFFSSYLFTELKKLHLFNFKFKYDLFLRSLKVFSKKKLGNLNVIWRPIFKKWSYLGYYRSNRSKWKK